MSEGRAGERPAATEHHIAVRRTARYYTLGEPGPVQSLWFVLHGYSQLARRFSRAFRPVLAPGRLVVAPEALNRYYSEYEPGHHRPDARVGATWMTREDRLTEIADYVHYLDRLYAELGAAAERTVLLGFSQGATTAARWAALGEARFHRVILWGGLVPPELPRTPGLFHGAALTLVAGRYDGYAGPAQVESESAALRAAGLSAEVRWFEGGHQLDESTLRALAAAGP